MVPCYLPSILPSDAHFDHAAFLRASRIRGTRSKARGFHVHFTVCWHHYPVAFNFGWFFQSSSTRGIAHDCRFYTCAGSLESVTASHIPECSEGAGKPWRVHRPRQRAPTRGLAARRRRPKPARPDERSTRARSDAPPPPPQPRRRSAPIAAIVESGAVPIRPEEPGARDGRWTSACGSSGRRLMRLDNEACEACESTCGVVPSIEGRRKMGRRQTAAGEGEGEEGRAEDGGGLG